VALAVGKMFRVDFSPAVWTAVMIAGVAPLVPLLFFFRKKWRAMLTASIASTALQFVAAIAFVLPPIAGQLTAKQLAAYFNARGAMPERLVVAGERVGSLVFYLDPQLRRRLRIGQIEQVDLKKAEEETASQFPLVATDVVAVPRRRAKEAEKYLDLRGWTSQTVGRYRLYQEPSP
jgi:hypothetical protein